MQNLEQKECIYWSPGKKECMLCRDGVFIPLPDHIMTFCQKDLFPKCHHFTKSNILVEDRRLCNRQNCRYPVVLKKSESLSLEINAQTLDVGIGGMSILCNQNLPAKGLVSFSLKIDNESKVIGKGEIRWVQKTAEMDCSQLGISFVEQTLERSS